MPKRWKVNEAIVGVVLALAVGAMVWWAVTLKQTRPSPIRGRSGSPEATRIEKPTRPVPLASTRLATNPAASVPGPTSLVTRQPTTPVPGSKQPVASPTPAVRSLAGPDNFPRPVVNVFEAQLALARLGISPGSIDGVSGSRTRAALLAFQQRENLPATGELDALTRSRLLLAEPPLTNYIVTSNDLARLRPLGSTWLEKSQQDRLDY